MHDTTRAAGSLFALLLLLSPSVPAQEGPGFQERREALEKAYAGARTPEEKLAILAEFRRLDLPAGQEPVASERSAPVAEAPASRGRIGRRAGRILGQSLPQKGLAELVQVLDGELVEPLPVPIDGARPAFPDEEGGSRPMPAFVRDIDETDALLRDLLAGDRRRLARILSLAGRPGAEGEAATIAGWLGDAYDRGVLTDDDLDAIFDPAGLEGDHQAPHDRRQGSFRPADPIGVATVIAGSGSERLMTEAAFRLLDLAYDPDTNRNHLYFAGAARAASGSAEAAESLLAVVGSGEETFDEFLSHIRPDFIRRHAGPDGDASVLGDLIGRTADRRPDRIAEDLFDKGTGLVDDDPSMRAGLGRVFRRWPRAVIDRLTAPEGDVLGNRATLVRFTEDVVFAPGGEEIRTALGRQIRTRVEDLMTGGDAGVDHDRALSLGTLIGSTEVGFRRAFERAEDENEARQAMAGLLYDVIARPVASAIPFDLSIPGVGSVKGKSSAWLRKKLTEHVTVDPPDVEVLVRPLYQVAHQIPSRWHDEMNSTRGALHDDELMDYLSTPPISR